MGGAKLARNADPDKYLYSGYGNRFDSRSDFSWTDDGSVGKNFIIFGVDMSLSVHIDNKKERHLNLWLDLTQGWDDTTLTAEAQYSINFSGSNRKFCLSLYYNGSNSILFVNTTKIYLFKAKYFEIKKHPLCLGNISRDFSVNNMKKKKKTGLNWSVCLLVTLSISINICLKNMI